jgi:hypothetical protein
LSEGGPDERGFVSPPPPELAFTAGVVEEPPAAATSDALAAASRLASSAAAFAASAAPGMCIAPLSRSPHGSGSSRGQVQMHPGVHIPEIPCIELHERTVFKPSTCVLDTALSRIPLGSILNKYNTGKGYTYNFQFFIYKENMIKNKKINKLIYLF